MAEGTINISMCARHTHGQFTNAGHSNLLQHVAYSALVCNSACCAASTVQLLALKFDMLLDEVLSPQHCFETVHRIEKRSQTTHCSDTQATTIGTDPQSTIYVCI